MVGIVARATAIAMYERYESCSLNSTPITQQRGFFSSLLRLNNTLILSDALWRPDIGKDQLLLDATEEEKGPESASWEKAIRLNWLELFEDGVGLLWYHHGFPLRN